MATMTDIEEITAKKTAPTDPLEAFEWRKNNQPKQIDNGALYAGSAMYFYCKHCGHIAEICPESYTWRPRSECKPCEDLRKQGKI